MQKAKQQGEYRWHAMVSSGGTLDLHLYFPVPEELTKKDKEETPAIALADAYQFMLQKGYIPPEARFMSPTDISLEYGKTRQYWEKLLDEGKIPHKETSAGRITTDLWVQGYVNNKEKVDEYIRNRNRALRSINESGKKSGRVICPACKEESFEFFVNVGGNTNGICRNRCGFHLHTIL